MAEVKTLKCSNCGGFLDVNMEDEIFTCKYCGASLVIDFEHKETKSATLVTKKEIMETLNWLRSVDVDDAILMMIEGMGPLLDLVEDTGIKMPAMPLSIDLDNKIFDEKDLQLLGNLPDIAFLSLGNTGLTDTGLRVLKKLPNIQTLILDRTEITDEGLANLKDLKKLESLHISYTGITDEGISHFTGLEELEYLNIMETEVTGAGIAKLLGLEKLSEIVHAGGNIDDIDMVRFGIGRFFSDSTYSLGLSGNKLKSADITSLKDFRIVERIDLSKNKINDDGLEHFAGLRFLKSLNLGNNSLKGPGLVHLHNLKKLTHLDLRGMKVNKEDVDKLKAAVPGLEVEL